MQRIKEFDLINLVARINEQTGMPTDTYSKTTTSVFNANIGNYHLSFAYGGVALYQIQTTGGGCIDVFGVGHVSKRELHNRLKGMLLGLSLSKKEA